MTHTRTSVYADAPCGCRFDIPNEAYDQLVALPAPCLHERAWSVIVDGPARFVRDDALKIARALHEVEPVDHEFAMSPIPWGSLARPDVLPMLLRLTRLLELGLIALAVPTVAFDDECGTCHSPILWRSHIVTGSRAPIDAVPNPAGNIVLDGDRYQIIDPADPDVVSPGGRRFTSHFATCPHAAQHRRR